MWGRPFEKGNQAARGHKRSPEHLAKMRAGWTSDRSGHLRKKSPEHLAKIGAALKGRKLSPKHKAKISAALKGNAKIIAANKSRKWSRESRDKLSKSRRKENGNATNIIPKTILMIDTLRH